MKIMLFFSILVYVSNSHAREKRNNRKTLTNYVTRQNNFVIAKSRILKGLKEQKVQVLPPFCKFITEVLIFAAANTFFQLNLVFIADSRTGFCSGLLWKHELNLRSSHWSRSVKKVVLRNFAKVYRKTPVLKSLFTRVSFYENFIKKGLQHSCFPWNLRSF